MPPEEPAKAGKKGPEKKVPAKRLEEIRALASARGVPFLELAAEFNLQSWTSIPEGKLDEIETFIRNYGNVPA